MQVTFISANSSSSAFKLVCNCFLVTFSFFNCSWISSNLIWISERWLSDFCKSSLYCSHLCNKTLIRDWFSLTSCVCWLSCNCKSDILLVDILKLFVNSTFCFSKSRIFCAVCSDTLLTTTFRCSAVWWLCSINLNYLQKKFSRIWKEMNYFWFLSSKSDILRLSSSTLALRSNKSFFIVSFSYEKDFTMKIN